MKMNMTVGGTIAEPFPQGKLQVSSGTVTYAGLPSGLSEMNGSLVFTRDRIHIEKLTARTGGGTPALQRPATIYDLHLNLNLTTLRQEVHQRSPPAVIPVPG